MADRKRGIDELGLVELQKWAKTRDAPDDENIPANKELLEQNLARNLFEEALGLLRAQPPLIGTVYLNGRTVLSAFLQGKAKRSMIQELCALHKEHAPFNDVSSWVGDSFERPPNPIADYCFYGGADGVLRLLCEEFPDCMLLPCDKYGRVPFVLYISPLLGLASRSPGNQTAPDLAELVNTLETMLEFSPNMLDSCGVFGAKDDILDRMVGKMNGEERGRQTYLFEQFAQRSNVQSFGIRETWFPFNNRRWGYDDISPVNLILPRQKEFRFENVIINEQAFSSLLHALNSVPDPLFTDFQFYIPKRRFVHVEENRRLLMETLKRSKHLKNLHFNMYEIWGDYTEPPMDIMIDLCRDVTDSNHQIESLTIEELVLPDSAGLSPLISNFSSLKNLTLRRLEVTNPEWVAVEAFNCSLEKILLTAEGHVVDDEDDDDEYDEYDIDFGEDAIELEPTWVKGFLNQARAMPLLTELIICHEGLPSHARKWSIDVSDEIVAILGENRLRSLTVDCSDYWFNVKRFSEKLIKNTSLKSLRVHRVRNPLQPLADVLEHHNVTLERIDGSTTSRYLHCDEQGGRAVCLSMLNRYGRTDLCSGSASLMGFVDGLCRLEKDAARESKKIRSIKDIFCNEAPHKHSVLYGLLHLAPSLWSTA